MSADTKTPGDLILQVLEAARDMAADHGGLGAIFSGPAHRLQAALDSLDAALDQEAEDAGTPEAGHWEPATWSIVRDGDRVRVGGQHEAKVTTALLLTGVANGASVVKVTLEGRAVPYTMAPSGELEVWRPSLPDWAAQAALMLLEKKEVASRG